MSEEDFQDQLIELLHYKGYLVAHFRPAKTDKGWRTPVSADGKGFPDLVAVKENRCLFIEVKSDKGKESEEQTTWLVSLNKTKSEVYVWRPRDWDYIVSVL